MTYRTVIWGARKPAHTCDQLQHPYNHRTAICTLLRWLPPPRKVTPSCWSKPIPSLSLLVRALLPSLPLIAHPTPPCTCTHTHTHLPPYLCLPAVTRMHPTSSLTSFSEPTGPPRAPSPDSDVPPHCPQAPQPGTSSAAHLVTRLCLGL